MTGKSIKHRCLMVFPDGHREEITRTTAGQIATWLTANKQFNREAALFVDGACRYRGRLSEDKIEQLAAELVSLSST